MGIPPISQVTVSVQMPAQYSQSAPVPIPEPAPALCITTGAVPEGTMLLSGITGNDHSYEFPRCVIDSFALVTFARAGDIPAVLSYFTLKLPVTAGVEPGMQFIKSDDDVSIEGMTALGAPPPLPPPMPPAPPEPPPPIPPSPPPPELAELDVDGFSEPPPPSEEDGG